MTDNNCQLCGEPLDEDGQCVACGVWTIEPLSEEDIALLTLDLATI